MKLLSQVPDFNAVQRSSGVNLAFDTPGGFIGEAVKYVFGIAGILLLVFLVMGGLQLMTSRGDPKAISAAQAKITNALIGFVILLVSGGIVVILGQILKVEVFSNIF